MSFIIAVNVTPFGKVPVGDSFPAPSTGTTTKSSRGTECPAEYAVASDSWMLSVNDGENSKTLGLVTLNPLTAPIKTLTVRTVLCSFPTRNSPLTSAPVSMTLRVCVPTFGEFAIKPVKET